MDDSALTAETLAQVEAKLANPIWRLTSGELYCIAPADGSGIKPFHPRPEQVAIIKAVYEDGATKILIPKARRLGMSTTLGIIAADCLLFRRTWQGSLIDQNQADASRKLDRIVRVALANLPDWLRDKVKYEKSNTSELSVCLAGQTGKSFFAGLNARGGSNDFLWVSEWGVIQYEDPRRSAKIRAGALPSARHGLIIVETTWAGGKGGDVWELLEPALSGKANDWRILFFPWWIDPRNVSETAILDDPARKYFERIEPRLVAAGIQLSEQQRRWWAAERRAQGIFMPRENPTFLDECWSAPIPGAIYAEAIDRARAEGRVCTMPVDGSNLVCTAWDLGSPENTTVWYFQVVGREIRIIDVDVGDRGTLTQRVAYMIAKGYAYGKHYLPHDCQQTERTGGSFLSELKSAGLPSASLCPVARVPSVWIGINHALELFPALSFRSPACDDALLTLAAYRTRRVGEGVLSVDEPVHDWASHTADAFRTMAEAHRSGLFAFKHTHAEARPDWYPGTSRRRRRGVKPVHVAA
jgi:hypothetical protein